MELGVDPYRVLKVLDGGDVDVRAGEPRRLARRAPDRRRAGARGGGVGGRPGWRPLAPMPVLRAIADRFGPDGYTVIHFDTHADTGLDMTEAPHGVPFSSAVQDGYLRGSNIIQIGLRGNWPYPHEFAWMREQGFRWRTITEVIELGIGAVVREAIEFARARAPRTYLTIDIDVLDPAFAPGTGTAEPGGLMTREPLTRPGRSRASSICCAPTWSRCRRRTTRPGSRPWRATGSCTRRCPGWPCAAAAPRPARSARDGARRVRRRPTTRWCARRWPATGRRGARRVRGGRAASPRPWRAACWRRPGPSPAPPDRGWRTRPAARSRPMSSSGSAPRPHGATCACRHRGGIRLAAERPRRRAARAHRPRSHGGPRPPAPIGRRGRRARSTPARGAPRTRGRRPPPRTPRAPRPVRSPASAERTSGSSARSVYASELRHERSGAGRGAAAAHRLSGIVLRQHDPVARHGRDPGRVVRRRHLDQVHP